MKQVVSQLYQRIRLSWQKINWLDKVVDLVIVVIGITVAFQLAQKGDSNKNNIRRLDYLVSFQEEVETNLNILNSALEGAKLQKSYADTLAYLLKNQQYADTRIGELAGRLTSVVMYQPHLTTMETVEQSGDLSLFKDLEFKRKAVNAYATLSRLEYFDRGFKEYVDKNIEPFYFSTVNYATFRPLNEREFVTSTGFTNSTVSYQMGVSGQVSRYEKAKATLENFTAALEQKIKEAQ